MFQREDMAQKKESWSLYETYSVEAEFKRYIVGIQLAIKFYKTEINLVCNP